MVKYRKRHVLDGLDGSRITPRALSSDDRKFEACALTCSALGEVESGPYQLHEPDLHSMTYGERIMWFSKLTVLGIATVALLAIGLSQSPAFSHSGGTDAYGYHNKHKTGGYHCH